MNPTHAQRRVESLVALWFLDGKRAGEDEAALMARAHAHCAAALGTPTPDSEKVRLIYEMQEDIYRAALTL